MKRLLLLGCGPAHLRLLGQLRRHPRGQMQVALVTPHAQLLHAPLLGAAVAGRVRFDQASIALRELTDAAHVNWAQAKVVRWDAAARVVHLSDGSMADYDLLSLDLDLAANRQVLPGAREHGLFLHPPTHFARLFDAVLPLAAQRALDVVVLGHDVPALELTLALERRLGADSGLHARLALVCGAAGVLPGLPDKLRAIASAWLQSRRIVVMPHAALALTRQHVMLDNGARLACDVPVLPALAGPPPWLGEAGLACDEQGWPLRLPNLQSTSHGEVFVARGSDQATAPWLKINLERFATGQPLKSAAHAVAQSPILCDGAGRAVWGGWGVFAAHPQSIGARCLGGWRALRARQGLARLGLSRAA